MIISTQDWSFAIALTLQPGTQSILVNGEYWLIELPQIERQR